jgi:hypothetical protein
LAGQVSRLTVAKVLKDALSRGAATVNYRGKLALYSLTEYGHTLTNQVVFSVWWKMGRPRLDDGFSLDKLRTDIYTTFLLDRYPLTKIKMSDFLELLTSLHSSLRVFEARLIDLYRSLSRRIVDYERQLEMRIRAGHDIMAINRWILEREVEGWPEDVILHKVAFIIESGLACKRCFERGRISEVRAKDEGYECPSCRRKTERPENFLKPEFEDWIKSFEEGGTPLKIGRLLIFPPRLKNGLLSSPSP